MSRLRTKSRIRLFLIVALGVLVSVGLLFSRSLFPKKTRAGSSFTSASATLLNSRFSYVAGVASGTSGNSNIQIDTSGNPDKNVNHLFPNDQVCFAPSSLSGCRDDKYYTVVSTEGVDGDQFVIDSPLGTTLNAADYVIATQSGKLTVAVTLANTIPDGGDLLVTIPTADSGTVTDAFPDYASTVAASGFDTGGLVAADVSIARTSGGTCADGDWSAAVISSASDLTIRFDRSGSTCDTTAVLAITIGDSDATHFLVNPAPINTSRTQGAADSYTINIKSRDNTDTTVDESDTMVAPVEAVLVSATVDETLTFRVCGVKTDLSTQETSCFSTPAAVCGQASLDVATYAYSVPFGSFSAADTFKNAAQYMYISTNAAGGYVVTVQQNDQMGKDGVTCTGDPTDPTTTNCIPDNPGDGTLDFDTSDDCDTASNNGLCFSADDGPQTGSPTFNVLYDTQSDDCDGSPTFCARSAADIESTETPETIYYGSDPVSMSDIFLCWRLSVDGTQPAGYYYNKVKYVATPTF